MVLILRLMLSIIRSLLKSKSELIMELAAKNQQLALYSKRFKRLKLKNKDRRLWVTLSRIWPEWRQSLIIVRPETVIRWHRYGFKYYWRWVSRKKKSIEFDDNGHGCRLVRGMDCCGLN